MEFLAVAYIVWPLVVIIGAALLCRWFLRWIVRTVREEWYRTR